MPAVKVYTRTTCGPCHSLKYWLKAKNIPFVELNADNDPALLEEVIRLSGYQQFPCTVIGDRVISGFNLPLLSNLLMV
jgi:glutaredoxin